ncbi:MAG: cytochrome c, partial [Bacteroidota bacterium]
GGGDKSSNKLSSVVILACAGGGDKTSNKLSESELRGQKLFTTYCVSCHGQDGKLGLNGSKDINESTLSFQERILLVTNGKNTMTPFKGIMSDAEIADVVAYSMTFKRDK